VAGGPGDRVHGKDYRLHKPGKTTIVFASHHGRDSGKIPDSWLEKLDPQIIVLGEAPSRHLNYYTGYMTITQNRAGDITMECVDDEVHFYVSNPNYSHNGLTDEGRDTFENYIGSITVETDDGVPLILMHFTGVAAPRRRAGLRAGPIKMS
jgi:hypothetical protein